MSDKTGGPAFPEAGLCGGMTLLDYFAGQWITGYVACPNTQNMSHENAAKAAYVMAAAMLTEKSRREGE